MVMSAPAHTRGCRQNRASIHGRFALRDSCRSRRVLVASKRSRPDDGVFSLSSDLFRKASAREHDVRRQCGLMADALDMLTNATACGLGLIAVTRGPRFKQYSARWTGVTLMLSPKTRSLQPPESSCDCPISTFTVGKLPAGVSIMSAKVVRIRKSVPRSRGLRNLDS